MNFEVVLLSAAQNEFRSILEYLERPSPQGAAVWLDAFEKTVDRLESDADKLAHAPENALVDFPIRHVMFRTAKGKPYRMLYTIVGQQVRVLHVRGPGQDLMRPDDV